MANYEIDAVAKAEGRRLARLIFGRRNIRTIKLTEQQFAGYLVTMFESGALWAFNEETQK